MNESLRPNQPTVEEGMQPWLAAPLSRAPAPRGPAAARLQIPAWPAQTVPNARLSGYPSAAPEALGLDTGRVSGTLTWPRLRGRRGPGHSGTSGGCRSSQTEQLPERQT